MKTENYQDKTNHSSLDFLSRSEKVACLFRRYFGDESKRKAADVCDIMYKGRLDVFQQYPHSIHLLFCFKDSSMNLQ